MAMVMGHAECVIAMGRFLACGMGWEQAALTLEIVVLSHHKEPLGLPNSCCALPADFTLHGVGAS